MQLLLLAADDCRYRAHCDCLSPLASTDCRIAVCCSTSVSELTANHYKSPQIVARR